MCDVRMVFLGSSQKEVGAFNGREPQPLALRHMRVEAANMKRGTPRNPKVAHLCSLLNIDLPEAIGILELLWHFTAEFSPQGDIGRHSDKAIAMAVGWKRPTGDKGVTPECKLSDSLVTSKWLDRDPVHRLIVHDWEEHADQSVRRRLARQKLVFVKPITSLPEPEPLPIHHRPQPPPNNGKPMMPPQLGGEYPLTIAEIRKHDPAVDDFFVAKLAHKVTQNALSYKYFPKEELECIDDKTIAAACRESYATGPQKHPTGLLLNRVPSIIITWGVEK